MSTESKNPELAPVPIFRYGQRPEEGLSRPVLRREVTEDYLAMSSSQEIEKLRKELEGGDVFGNEYKKFLKLMELLEL